MAYALLSLPSLWKVTCRVRSYHHNHNGETCGIITHHSPFLIKFSKGGNVIMGKARRKFDINEYDFNEIWKHFENTMKKMGFVSEEDKD